MSASRYVKEPSVVILTENPKKLKEKQWMRWHDKTLPGSMVKLYCKEGQRILRGTTIRSSITGYYADQRNRAFCGPQSVAICMNYLGLGSKTLKTSNAKGGTAKGGSGTSLGVKAKYEDEYDTILDENDIRFHAYVLDDFRDIDTKGVTLQQLSHACLSLGLRTALYHANIKPTTNISINGQPFRTLHQHNEGNILHNEEEFRSLVQNTLLTNNACLIVNYFMGSLGYTGCRGHFSPIGAYESSTDMCLVLDVWPDTPPAWVKLSNLFVAMDVTDDASGLSRGCLVLRK